MRVNGALGGDTRRARDDQNVSSHHDVNFGTGRSFSIEGWVRIATDVTNSGDLFLGRHVRDSNCTLAGVLDEVGIYNRILSPSEIERIYLWCS